MTHSTRKIVIILSLLLIQAVAGFSQETIAPALAALVSTERAFARMSVEKGTREAFLAFFADDGINFQPHPTKTREAILKRPPPTTRPRAVLNWQPAYADISGAGDLGYTTGPYTTTDQSEQKLPTR